MTAKQTMEISKALENLGYEIFSIVEKKELSPLFSKTIYIKIGTKPSDQAQEE